MFLYLKILELHDIEHKSSQSRGNVNCKTKMMYINNYSCCLNYGSATEDT